MNYPITNRIVSKFKVVTILLCIVLTGSCYYIGNGLHGDYWYLVWLAPVPVLMASLATSGRATFLISFMAYLIGRLSWFSYLVSVATVVPAIIFTVLLSLIFALIICSTRLVIYRINAWYTVFAFPVFFTTFEFLVIKLSPNGSGGSIAYSQLDFLPVVQLASVTGILGITFFITLIPSAIAVGWYFRKEKASLIYTVGCSFLMIGTILLFGIVKLNEKVSVDTIKVGLAVYDEKKHNNSNQPDIEKDKSATDFYVSKVRQFAKEGTQVALFPERALSMDSGSVSSMLNTLCNAAKDNNIHIITGYTNLTKAGKYNSALVINADGKVVANYDKTYLVEGLETQFIRGKSLGLFSLTHIPAGVAICKDMDFQDYIQQYGSNKTSIMFVPAWDFIVDDWLHSRMSILRGVENGFSEARVARQGALTISDHCGRVSSESSCSNDLQGSLTGTVSTKRYNTIYTRWGNWFGMVNLLATFLFVAAFYKRYSYQKLRSVKQPVQ